jgi:hypothetical protein
MSRRASEDGQRRAGAVAAAVCVTPRGRGRCFDVVVDEAPTTTGRRRCRSCAAVAIADCVALGCCPCAVVSLLALALVKAPFVVGRRCVGRLRRRRRLLLHQKRVRDHEEEKGVGKATAVVVAATSAGGTGATTTEADLAWLEEMYRVGHWGFGRVSFSGEKENPMRS